jgi:hypothetical protein
MSKFPYAYCLETCELLTPDDITEYALSTGKMPRLACADAECRRERPDTRMSPVCCNPEEECHSTMIPYLRTYPKHSHSETCHYGEVSDNLDYIMSHRSEFTAHDLSSRNFSLRLKAIDDATVLPDKYLLKYDPREYKEAIQRETSRLSNDGSLSRKQAMRIALCKIQHKTSSLSLIVKIAEKLDKKDELHDVPLQIPGRASNTNSYNAFFNIHNLHESYKYTPYILYDYATIERQSSGYAVIYDKPIFNYCKAYQRLQAVTFISDDDLHDCRHNKSLSKLLNEYSQSEKGCCVYSFSTHCLNASNCPLLDVSECVVIEPRTLDSVVIRKRCINRSKNK